MLTHTKNLEILQKKSFNAIGSILKKANSLINSFGKGIKEAFSKFSKSASGATRSANGFSFSLKNILKYGFGIRSLYVLVNKLRSGMKEGFANLLTYSQSLEDSVNNIKASALTLKNVFAAAFSPFVEIALPYVQKLLDYMIQLTNAAGQFFAAITGQKAYTKAIKQTVDAFKDAKKAAEGYLNPLDEINKYSDGKDKGTLDGTTMFEEAAIDSNIFGMAEKIKDVLSKLFEPLKKAWNRDGKFVIDSWKYALEELRNAVKDIGRDFFAIWQEENTTKIFQDILRIVGDIGITSGNMSRNFREAWNENSVGLGILQKVRDIIGIITSHIKNAADATIKWSNNLDFYPLLVYSTVDI